MIAYAACVGSGKNGNNTKQAARVSERTAFFLLGELVEEGPTERLFTAPSDPRTADYIEGRFG